MYFSFHILSNRSFLNAIALLKGKLKITNKIFGKKSHYKKKKKKKKNKENYLTKKKM
jgi:hypothetical protein